MAPAAGSTKSLVVWISYEKVESPVMLKLSELKDVIELIWADAVMCHVFVAPPRFVPVQSPDTLPVAGETLW